MAWTVFQTFGCGFESLLLNNIRPRTSQKALEVKIELSGSKPSQLERPIIEKGQFSKKGSLTGTPATVSVKRYFSGFSDFLPKKISKETLETNEDGQKKAARAENLA